MQRTTQTAPAHTIETSLDGGATRYSFFEASEAVLRPLMDDLFGKHWSSIVVGPCMEGAVFEIQFEKAPKVTHLDGYMTVDLGRWHFHMCIGPTKTSTSEEVCRKRPVAKAALFESRGVGHGHSWGMRFWNGFGDQMTTVFLPNPRLTDEMKFLKEPDWNRLRLYYELRERLLSEPVPADFKAAAEKPWPETIA